MSTMYHLVTGENHLGVGKVKTGGFSTSADCQHAVGVC